jgi:hypothetical protein
MTAAFIPRDITGLYCKPFQVQLFLLINGKGKAVPVHTMKAYRGSRCIAPLILTLSTGWKSVVNFILWLLYAQKMLLNRRMWARGSSELVQTFWRRENSYATSRLQTPVCPANSLVTVPTAF